MQGSPPARADIYCLRKSETQTKARINMVRIAGVDLPAEKRADIALTYLYGIGRMNVKRLLEKVNIDPAKRLNTFSDEDVSRIAKALEKDFVVEGDLRQQVTSNIKRLREIG